MPLPSGFSGVSRSGTAPLEVTLCRGCIGESKHRVHAVVCDGRGRVLMSAGDPGYETFIRSALKPFQALPFLSSGAAAQMEAGERGIAISCGSHLGTNEHAREAFRLLWNAELEPPLCSAPSRTGPTVRCSTTAQVNTPLSWRRVARWLGPSTAICRAIIRCRRR